jgi:DNA-binding transcriptional regulator YhcF (GntR family)
MYTIDNMKQEANLVIDPTSTVPIYRQVVDSLRSLLVEGALQPGDNLPTVRELGFELGVHFNTIAEAYRLLAEEGWLELKRRRGAIVLTRSTPLQQPEQEESFRRNLRKLVAQVRSEGLSITSITNELEQLIRELTA